MIPIEIYYKIITYIPRYDLTKDILIDQKYKLKIIKRLKYLDIYNDNIKKDILSRKNLLKEKYYEYQDTQYFISLSIKKMNDYVIIYS